MISFVNILKSIKRITFKIKLSTGDRVSTHVFQIWEQTDKPFLPFLQRCAQSIQCTAGISLLLKIWNYNALRKAKSKELLFWPLRHQFNIFQQQLCQKSMCKCLKCNDIINQLFRRRRQSLHRLTSLRFLPIFFFFFFCDDDFITSNKRTSQY